MLFICLIGACILFRNSPVFGRIISLVFMIYMGWLGGNVAFDASNGYPDYNQYETAYLMQWSNYESGYNFVQSLGARLGMNYVQFRTALAICAMVILWVGFNLLSSHVSSVVGMYAVTTFLIDTVQVRSTVMLAFEVLALGIILKKNNKLGDFVGLLLILVGAAFHTTGFLFLLAFLTWLVLRRYSIHMSIRLVTIMSVISLFTMSVSGIVTNLILNLIYKFSFRTNIAVGARDVYSSGNSWKVCAATFLLVVFILTIITWTQNNPAFILTGSAENMTFVMVFLFLIGLVLLPLAPDYSRIIRYASVLFLIYISLVKVDAVRLEFGSIYTQQLLLNCSVGVCIIITFILQNVWVYKIGSFFLPEIRL